MLVVSAVAACVGRRPEPVVTETAQVLPAFPALERDGLRWEYDALADHERLLDVSGGARVDVTADRPDLVLALRVEALRALGVRDLGALREAHRPAAETLRRLGYL